MKAPWEFVEWVAIVCVSTALVTGTSGAVGYFMAWLQDRAEKRNDGRGG